MDLLREAYDNNLRLGDLGNSSCDQCLNDSVTDFCLVEASVREMQWRGVTAFRSSSLLTMD